MKIAVYSIAKNEEQFVERWAKSAWEADEIVLLDTGSTDNTVSIAQQTLSMHSAGRVYTKSFSPWRFDHARNESMSLISSDVDVCISLDVDEVLVPGWRQAMEAGMTKHPETTRPRYKYVWSWNADGSEGLVYGGDKIHIRNNYIWKHPVHEVLAAQCTEVQTWIDGFEIHHHPDKSKSRAQYFELLKVAVEEEPEDDRNQFYLARDYFSNGEYDHAVEHFNKFLTLSKWGAERSAAYRYMAQMLPNTAESLLYKAIAEAPERRESWFSLIQYYYNKHEWSAVKATCEMLFMITEKPLDYLCEAEPWGWHPHDYMAIACYQLGNYEEACKHGKIALQISPSDERLVNNLIFYSEKHKDGD